MKNRDSKNTNQKNASNQPTATRRNTDWYLSSTERKIRKAQVDGYKMGVLSGLVVLNDYFDFTDEEMSEFVDGCMKVTESIHDGESDAGKISKKLEEMTGVSLFV